jgi:tRNA 2-thiouridine synthesizing protein B
MILHTLSAAPAEPAFDSCLRIAAPGDRILLLGNGVYAAMTSSPAAGLLSENPATFFALAQDVAAAGLAGKIADGIEVVDFDGFVALTETCERQLNW